MNNRLISALAHAFSNVLKEWLTDEEMQKVIERNNSPEYSELWCASHDFCDANMAMNTAFELVLGRNAQGDNAQDMMIWNKAWYLAKEKNFFVE